MINKDSFSLLILLIILASCGKKHVQKVDIHEENMIMVAVPKPDYTNQHFFDAEKYADSVKFVHLETTSGNLIADVSELLFVDDYIIVVDAKIGTIHFFDYNGKYSHKIHRRGRGPGEYLSFGRVMLSEDDSLIVYDIDGQSLIYYDFDGNCLSKIDDFCDGMVARDIINLPTGEFLCYRQDKLGMERKLQAGLWRAKADGDFDKFIYPFSFDYEANFVQYDYHLSALQWGGVSFVDQNQTAVFHVDGDVISKIVQFELPGKTAANFSGDNESTEGYYSIFLNQEKGDFIFTNWSDDKNSGFNTILTKSTGELESGLSFAPFAFDEYLPGGNFVRNNDSHICSSWFYPSDIKRVVESNLPEAFRTKANRLLIGFSDEQIETSNPTLQLLYIKRQRL